MLSTVRTSTPKAVSWTWPTINSKYRLTKEQQHQSERNLICLLGVCQNDTIVTDLRFNNVGHAIFCTLRNFALFDAARCVCYVWVFYTNARAKQFQSSKIKNSVAASDAFFPFADGINALIKAGVKTIIQPGGSIKDQEIINAANKAKIKMFFTGIRHFNH